MKNAISFGALIGLVLVSVFTFKQVVDSKVAISEISAQSQSAATVVSAATSIDTNQASLYAWSQRNSIRSLKSALNPNSITATEYNKLVTIGTLNCNLLNLLGFPCELKAVEVSVPNGGETWTKGSAQSISWTQKIELYPHPGTVGVTHLALVGVSNPSYGFSIATNIPNSTTTYNWQIPTTIPNGTYRVRATLCPSPNNPILPNTSTLNCIDESDGIFSIGGTSTATTTQPIVSFVGSSEVKNVGQISGQPDTVDLEIEFKVQAVDKDIYIDGDVVQGSTTPGVWTDGLAWATTTNSTTGTGTIPAFINAQGTSGGDTSSAGDIRYKITKGNTRNFTLVMTIPAGTDASAVGSRITGIKWDTISQDKMTKFFNQNIVNFKTNTVTGLFIR